MPGIQFNGLWSKIIAALGTAGLLAAVGAAVRLEVLAAELEHHEEQPTHADDPTVEAIQGLRDASIRQEAVNQKVERTADKVKRIDEKIDALLRSKDIDPSSVHER